MRRFLVAAVAGALVVGVLAAAPADPECAIAEPGEANWGTIRPGPPNRDNRIVSSSSGSRGAAYAGFGVGRLQGLQAAVVDTRALQVTRDAGCSWEEPFRFSDDLDLQSDLEPSTSRFVDVAVSQRESGDERMVALVYDLEVSQQARVRTLVSEDGGRTFEVGGRGLPDALELPGSWDGCGDDQGCEILVAPSDPDVVYVVVEGWEPQLWLSTDGAMTFRRQNGGAVPFASVGEGRDAYPSTLAVDKVDASTLWAGERSGALLSSTSHGNTWFAHDIEDVLGVRVDGIQSVAIAHGPEGSEVLAVARTGNDEWILHSDDGGQVWTTFPSTLRNLTIDVAGGTEAGAFVATTRDGAYRLDLEGQTWRSLGGRSLGPLSDVHLLAGSDTVWFRGPGSLPVVGSLQFTPPPPTLDFDFDLEAFDPLNPQGPLPGQLTGPDHVIRLAVNARLSVPMVLDLPVTRTPLDVFFLFDQSGSMSEEMQALARGMAEITNELIRRRIDLWVGLGGYSGGWRYQLHEDIQPPGPTFQRALESLRPGGGSGIEPAYTALHQIATGTGLENSRAGFGPEEGWNAHWRHGAVRIVVNLTDEPLQVEREGPSIEETIGALQEHRIKVVGLVSDTSVSFSSESPTSVDRGIDPRDSGYGPVASLANKTEAKAGPSGVDCGGDGEIDIAEGGPLACYLSPLVMAAEPAEQADLLPDFADVVIEILEGVTEVHEVEFFAEDRDVVQELVPLDPVVVDIRDPQVINLRATVGCPPHRAGQTISPLVSAVASSRILGATHLVVQCGPLPLVAALEAPAIPEVANPAAVAAAPPAPPPPPAPVTVGAQAAAGAQAPGAATSVIPQVGVAAVTQQEQQHQLAGIGGPGLPGEEPELSLQFSSRRDTSNAPATLLAGAAMTAAAGALARRRQSAPRPARSRVRP